VSGSKGRPHFTPWALRQIFQASRGIPRIINNLCDKAVLAAFIRDSDEVNYWDARRAVKEVNQLTD
jgi:general secretion pathway protein A